MWQDIYVKSDSKVFIKKFPCGYAEIIISCEDHDFTRASVEVLTTGDDEYKRYLHMRTCVNLWGKSMFNQVRLLLTLVCTDTNCTDPEKIDLTFRLVNKKEVPKNEMVVEEFTTTK